MHILNDIFSIPGGAIFGGFLKCLAEDKRVKGLSISLLY